MSAWTDEQIKDAMTYGLCLECKAPRTARMMKHRGAKGFEYSYQVICTANIRHDAAGSEPPRNQTGAKT